MKRYIRIPIKVLDDNPRRCSYGCEYATTLYEGTAHCRLYQADLRDDARGRPIRCRACLAAETTARRGGEGE